MLNKIYIVLISIAFIVAAILTFFSYSWLQSIGNPQIAANNFQSSSGLLWTYIWISFIVLIIFANILLWKMKKGISIWLAFVYFAIFITLYSFWLEPSFTAFKNTNGLAENTLSTSPFFGLISIIVVAIAVFFNQFLLNRLRTKVFGDDNIKSKTSVSD